MNIVVYLGFLQPEPNHVYLIVSRTDFSEPSTQVCMLRI